MPRQYSSSVRRQIVARLRSGEPVAAVAVETGVCQATPFRWKRQALIDAGVIEGMLAGRERRSGRDVAKPDLPGAKSLQRSGNQLRPVGHAQHSGGPPAATKQVRSSAISRSSTLIWYTAM
ncbi:hypothetical protein B1987_13560 [Mycobacterium kansasii]|uniref:Uncharacterized protein n=1 Tax=Mycobacterium attenuatum TaxID=2341086 RepID=A0A498QJS7_9MYCO|nr:transposase [Mycobacterium attenuatum]ORB84651.1 hypothetical protein B1987_13560 [Mycobacterium kansasii]VBA43860.1 hypothetical protein LAUMK136_05333 [Mycobacterium attenuatum]VBA60000.1 hypothetical protein LAUMK191_05311 [Mycobacterium attenuatum]